VSQLTARKYVCGDSAIRSREQPLQCRHDAENERGYEPYRGDAVGSSTILARCDSCQQQQRSNR
jgi:hypothetical protein